MLGYCIMVLWDLMMMGVHHVTPSVQNFAFFEDGEYLVLRISVMSESLNIQRCVKGLRYE